MRLSLEESLRAAPVVDRGGYPYIIHPLLDGNPRVEAGALEEWVAWLQEQGDLVEQATLLVAPEAMALPLAAAATLATGIPYVVARKRPYGLPGEVRMPVRTGYGAATLHLNDVGPDDRVLIVDDVLSTGATLGAVLQALEGRCRVVGALVLVDKGDASDALQSQHDVPVRVRCRLRVEAGAVVVEG